MFGPWDERFSCYLWKSNLNQLLIPQSRIVYRDGLFYKHLNILLTNCTNPLDIKISMKR